MKALISLRQSKDSHGADIDTLESAYVEYYEALGIQLIPVPNFTKNPKSYFDLGVDLLILTGGGSIPGKYYNPPKEGVDSPERDFVEEELLQYAVSHDIPVLAICRGMQYTNALYGGKLSVLSELPVKRPVGTDHEISIHQETILVNNYHNDGIYLSDLSHEMEPMGVDVENKVVEIYKHKTARILAIQSHPERKMSDIRSKEYITNLISDFIRNHK